MSCHELTPVCSSRHFQPVEGPSALYVVVKSSRTYVWSSSWWLTELVTSLSRSSSSVSVGLRPRLLMARPSSCSSVKLWVRDKYQVAALPCSWWCPRHQCRTGWTPPATALSAPESALQNCSSPTNSFCKWCPSPCSAPASVSDWSDNQYNS